MIQGYTYFGDIFAESEEVECIFIDKEKFNRIPAFEQLLMKQYCISRDDIQMLAYFYSNKYGKDIQEYTYYYG